MMVMVAINLAVWGDDGDGGKISASPDDEGITIITFAGVWSLFFSPSLKFSAKISMGGCTVNGRATARAEKEVAGGRCQKLVDYLLRDSQRSGISTRTLRELLRRDRIVLSLQDKGVPRGDGGAIRSTLCVVLLSFISILIRLPCDGHTTPLKAVQS
ncbi:hypothetical protein Bbelb_296660 [Branchiostoma belcheri]|nr:hypothetical protein Bbelb_296660 [Branchiostoma belcheri]